MNKSTLLGESVYRRLELEGVFIPKRDDFVRSAIAFLLELLVAHHGHSFDKIHEMILSSNLFLKKNRSLTAKETEEVRDKNARRFMEMLKQFIPFDGREKQ